MSSLSYELVTPSFRLDLDRCSMLLESVERWVHPSVRHYLIVDRRDVPLFKPLLNPRTQLLVVEDVVPPWIVRILATSDEKLRAAMEHYQADLAQQVHDKDAAVQERYSTDG